MTKSRELDEEQRQDADVNKRHYGEDVKFYQIILVNSLHFMIQNVILLKDCSRVCSAPLLVMRSQSYHRDGRTHTY